MHLEVTDLKNPFGYVIDPVVACESDPSGVFFIACVIIPNPVHHLDKDILAVHQLVVIPLGAVVQVLLHEVRVGVNVGDLKVQVVLQIFELLHLGHEVLVDTCL